MICPRCKIEIPDDSLYCDMCGGEIRYCQICRKPGKGNRCTRCGGVMVAAASVKNQGGDFTGVTIETATPSPHTAPAPPTADTTVKVGCKSHLILSNSMLGLTIEGVDGATIGRRQGIYQRQFSGFPYVSGTHARLNYDAVHNRWTVTDLGSSNGSKFDGEPLSPGIPCPLTDGGKLQLANILLNVSVTLN
ncbi:MAG: FHA domain-containing protein [Bacteroidaceae bacterium]|nr:FHA domain-containing protein [Bacteroidaceae bacterium]